MSLACLCQRWPGVAEKGGIWQLGRDFMRERAKFGLHWPVMHVQKFNPGRLPWSSLSGRCIQREMSKANSGV